MHLVFKRFFCPRLTAYTKHSHLLHRIKAKMEMSRGDQFIDSPKREIHRMNELTTENVFKALKQETGTEPTLIYNHNDTICAHNIIVRLNTHQTKSFYCRYTSIPIQAFISSWKDSK